MSTHVYLDLNKSGNRKLSEPCDFCDARVGEPCRIRYPKIGELHLP